MWPLLTGCHHAPEPLTVADDLFPLEPNRADWPTADGDPYPEELSTASGGDPTLWWAHGRGYLKVPLAQAWEAATDPEVGVDRREVDEWSSTPDPQPQLDESYIVHTTVNDVITVDFDMWWRYEVQDGTLDEPLLAVGQWSKTEGTSFIELLEGSIVLRQVPGEDVTEVELEEHLNAALRDDQTLVRFLEDFHASMVAFVHDRPLPSY